MKVGTQSINALRYNHYNSVSYVFVALFASKLVSFCVTIVPENRFRESKSRENLRSAAEKWFWKKGKFEKSAE